MAETNGARKIPSGTIAVFAVLAIGVATLVGKFAQELRIEPHVMTQVAILRDGLARLDPKGACAEEHKSLRKWLAEERTVRELDYYRDRAIPFLIEQYKKDRDAGLTTNQAAFLIVITRINSTRAVAFAEEELPRVTEPDLRRDLDRFIQRNEAWKRAVGSGATNAEPAGTAKP